MKKGLVITGVVVLVLLLFGSFFVSKYNTLVVTEENIDGKWAQVENQLQRRADLIPNLVSTVKGYASHEKETLTQVTEARAKVLGAKGVAEKANANEQLTGALSRLMLVAEKYPDLKANQNFMKLQDELSGSENRIAVARKDYNEAIQKFNSTIKQFPYLLFGFDKYDYFKADESAKEVPKVEF